MVNGQWLMRERGLLTLDEARVRAEAQRIASQVGAFLARREQSLLDKLVALGTLQWGETYEVQVKVWVPDEELLVARLLACPEVMVIKPSERKQYDTYFSFGDPEDGIIRYREDYLLDRGLEVKPIYNLTLRGTNAGARVCRLGSAVPLPVHVRRRPKPALLSRVLSACRGETGRQDPAAVANQVQGASISL